MHSLIANFNQQFAWKPMVHRSRSLFLPQKIFVTGMGGSHLAADLLKDLYPEFCFIHHNYGLPPVASADRQNTLFIFSSYSGNTEETLSGFRQSLKAKLPTAVIASGGQLLTAAKKYRIPYIQLPIKKHLQPRMALGYSLMALLKISARKRDFAACRQLKKTLRPLTLEKRGRLLAKQIGKSIPLVYSSGRLRGLALNWKVRFNETAKIPAFFNTFPELNHNEMISPSSCFYYLFITDAADFSKIKKRIEITKQLYQRRCLKTTAFNLTGKFYWKKIFSSIVLADWTAYHLAVDGNKNPEEIPLIEEFKKMIK